MSAVTPIFTPDWNQIEEQAAAYLKDYLCIDTTNPPGNEVKAAHFLADLLSKHNIAADVIETGDNRANLLAVVPGTDIRQPPIVLLHHMDVVPANASDWEFDPFGGIEKDGYIYGRGALDVKSLGIMQMLGLATLFASGRSRNRHLIFLAVADEEVNSEFGARWALQYWRDWLTDGVVWGEGGFGIQGLLPTGTHIGIATSEKLSVALRVTAHGQAGHGSTPHSENANEILLRALLRVCEWKPPLELTTATERMLREFGSVYGGWRGWLMQHPQVKIPQSFRPRVWVVHPMIEAMLQDTISLTILRGGEKDNVIPGISHAVLDVRLLPNRELTEFIARLNHIINDERVSVEVIDEPISAPVSPDSHLLFQTIARVMRRHVPDAVITPLQLTGTTDGRWFRQQGMPTYGISPIVVNQNELAGIHGKDERISRANLRMGTQVVFETLLALCSGEWSV